MQITKVIKYFNLNICTLLTHYNPGYAKSGIFNDNCLKKKTYLK